MYTAWTEHAETIHATHTAQVLTQFRRFHVEWHKPRRRGLSNESAGQAFMMMATRPVTGAGVGSVRIMPSAGAVTVPGQRVPVHDCLGPADRSRIHAAVRVKYELAIELRQHSRVVRKRQREQVLVVETGMVAVAVTVSVSVTVVAVAMLESADGNGADRR